MKWHTSAYGCTLTIAGLLLNHIILSGPSFCLLKKNASVFSGVQESCLVGSLLVEDGSTAYVFVICAFPLGISGALPLLRGLAERILDVRFSFDWIVTVVARSLAWSLLGRYG